MPKRVAAASHLLTVGAVVIAAVAFLGGCTAAPLPVHHPHSDAPSPSASPVTVVLPTEIPNDPSARKSVVITMCGPGSSGHWRASGTIENASSAARDYRITVFFTNRSSTVIGYAQTGVRVAAGAEKAWKAQGAAAHAVPTLCVLRGVR